MSNDVLHRQLMEAIDTGGLRIGEISAITGVHRVTVSRWVNGGKINCDRTTLTRLMNLINLVNKAIQCNDLPLDKRGIKGKDNRLAALKTILLQHHAKSLKTSE